jgi:hypothetical protein
MARVECPDCGFVHECGSPEPDATDGEQRAEKKSQSREARGYSIYYVPCRCGCGCGHSCSLKYGPYGKAHNAQGRAALQGEAGEQLRAMREASAKVRRGHLTRVHGHLARKEYTDHKTT